MRAAVLMFMLLVPLAQAGAEAGNGHEVGTGDQDVANGGHPIEVRHEGDNGHVAGLVALAALAALGLGFAVAFLTDRWRPT